MGVVMPTSTLTWSKMSVSIQRLLKSCRSPLLWRSSLVPAIDSLLYSTQIAAPFPNDESVRDLLEDDKTKTMASLNNTVCLDPKQAKTNLLNFLNQSDMTKRKANMTIPYFTAGSYISVTRGDPFSPSGESKFVGICIAKRKVQTIGSTFTLRNVMNGIGVEMMFELYSPAIKDIKVLKLERRRRAKLYYLRDKPPKYSTVKESMKPVVSDGKVQLYRRKPGDPA